ncbi:hypothetical protein GF339_06990 [candidate division KSB3 bacterium]|uniref:Xylulokinase n=1 Tax=candidate division KSB3 bacterium TaxID=2044937 RepID=A0A9D5Q5G5_9BACT|nr:hypothetical protein [candidate division KSB3 bacterium]MBD3324313.1 hypothetical protein [candidate division KSB3 bacterium]
MERYLLGIDVGTTGCKVGLFSLSGERIALTRGDYHTHHPQPGCAEQDPLEWWNAIKTGIQMILQQSGIAATQIAAIGVDSHVPTLLPLHANGDVAYPAMIWADSRAKAESRWISQQIPDETFIQICGNTCTPNYLAPKIKWFQAHEPQAFLDTAVFLQVNGYINYKLTGNLSMDISNSELTLMADKTTGAWSTQICEALKIPMEKLPEVKECTEVIGTVSQTAAKETSLAEGTPVIAGGNDTAMSVLTLNIVEHGQAFLDIGHATNPGVCLDKPASCSICNLYHHVLPHRWLLQAYVGTTGAALRWFKETLGETETHAAAIIKSDPYTLLSEVKAAEATPGSAGLLFLPYLAGAQEAPDVRGTFLGLSTSTTKAEMIRALLEGCAFAVRRNIELVERAAGLEISAWHTTGGGANSDLWCQIHADITGKQVLVPRVRDGAVLGSALLAGIGTGVLPKDLDLKKIAPIDREYTPIASHQAIYDERYEQFCRAYDLLTQYAG